MARRGAAVAKDGRAARAKEEMPLHKEVGQLRRSNWRNGRNWAVKKRSNAFNVPLEHLAR